MIPYGRHLLDDDDISAVVETLHGDWLSTGPTVDRFEEALQAWTGGVPTVAVSSGTAALHAAYAGAGLGPGDEVITPPITFVATQAALLHVGATPVFADVELDTANIDPAAVEAAISPRSAAIVAVDYAGNPADMESLRRLSERHGLLLIEDAAHSLGSKFQGRFVGSLADITTFSFFPTKNITTAEGGCVASAHADILAQVRRFSRQGLLRNHEDFVLKNEGPWHQEVHQVGLNYRLSDIQASLGLSQLGKLDKFKERRCQIKNAYDEAFRGIDGVDIPAKRVHSDPVWHLYPLRVPKQQRREVFVRLRDDDIGVQVNYLPAYRHPALAHFGRPEAFPASEEFYAREISLPMHVGLSDDEIAKVIEATLQALDDSR